MIVVADASPLNCRVLIEQTGLSPNLRERQLTNSH
jgi:hypothetical protein